ncbi:hypothetical protein GW764_01110 [Candidatus Parcubacteria bacterium]|nr:hypothetical protein [Candidatus Parcubacteria bacterium]
MKTTTSIKLDKEVKEQASDLAKELGLSLSGVINATLKQFVNDRSVFLTTTPQFNEKAAKRMLKLMDDAKKGKNLCGPFKTDEELFKALEI